LFSNIRYQTFWITKAGFVVKINIYGGIAISDWLYSVPAGCRSSFPAQDQQNQKIQNGCFQKAAEKSRPHGHGRDIEHPQNQVARGGNLVVFDLGYHQHDGCQGDDQADAQTDRTRTGDDREEKPRIDGRGPHQLCAVFCVFE